MAQNNQKPTILNESANKPSIISISAEERSANKPTTITPPKK